MKASEIRAMSFGPGATDYFLREIAAQLAEINDSLRVKNSRKAPAAKASISSSSRRTSFGMTFYVHHWQCNQKGDALRDFIPREGQKALDDLAINESSLGALGTVNDAKITRVLS